MNMSTPLSKLPPINEELIQAPLDQNQNQTQETPMSNENDDQTIQEVLNGLNQPYPNNESYTHEDPQERMQDHEHEEDFEVEQADTDEIASSSNKSFNNLVSLFIKDLKLLIVLCVAFFVSYVLPLNKVYSAFTILQTIPYSKQIVRSLIGSVLAYILIKNI